MAARLPAPAWTTLVHLRRHAGLSAAHLLLVVVSLRCLCVLDLPQGGGNRGLGRLRLYRHRHRHVGVACPRGQGGHHLWLGPLGDEERDSIGPDCWVQTESCSAATPAITCDMMGRST